MLRPTFIQEPGGRLLKWQQPHAMIRYHELKSDGILLATLRWPKMYGSLAIAECSAGRYTFKRAGFLRPCVTARVEGTKVDIAVLKLRLGLSGSIEMRDRARFILTRPNRFKSKWRIVDENGYPILSMTRGKGKPKGDVTLHGDVAWKSYPHLLSLIGWYAIILAYEEGEAAVGGTVLESTG